MPGISNRPSPDKQPPADKSGGNPAAKAASPFARRDDLKRILRDLDDAAVLEVLALQPSVADVEEAALYAAGIGDGLDRSGHPLTGTVARIVAIIDRQDEPDR
jgi:hypothetical protein